MSLKGNLSSVNLTEIFQMLSLSGREGTLFIYEGARKRAICFTQTGVSIRSRERNESNLLGKLLVRLGHVDEEALARAVEQKRSSSKLLGDVLISQGECTAENIQEAFSVQSQEDIQDLFLSRSDAQFEYVDGYFPESEAPYVDLNVNQLLIEIARRTDEWEYIRHRIRGPREIYRFTSDEGEVDADILTDCYAHRIDNVIDGTRSVGDIIDDSYVNKFHVCKLLAAYLDAGVIEPVPTDAIRQTARLALRMGDAEGAIRHYEYLMSAGDFTLEVMAEAAQAHEANRDFAEAAALLRRLAEEHVREGRDREAIDTLRRIANFPRPEPEALRYLLDLVFANPRVAPEFSAHIIEAGKTMVAHYLRGDHRIEANELLDHLLELFPDEIAFAVSLVNLYYDEGNADRAASECERMANGFLKRKRISPAVSLYKKLLVIDPERQDIRDKIRKIVAGKRSRKSGGMLPRALVALAIALLMSGIAVVYIKGGGLGGSDKHVDTELQTNMLDRARSEAGMAGNHARGAIRKYARLIDLIGADTLDSKGPIEEGLLAAEQDYEQFLAHADAAQSVLQRLREQFDSDKIAADVRSMNSALHTQRSEVGAEKAKWEHRAMQLARGLLIQGFNRYEEAKLLPALECFELALLLATDDVWIEDSRLVNYIENIRADIDIVKIKREEARTLETAERWIDARRIYIELIREFGRADLIEDIRLPLMIDTLPGGVTIHINGQPIPAKAPHVIRLNAFIESDIQLSREGYEPTSMVLGPFGKNTDPEDFIKRAELLKMAMLELNLGSSPIDSRPVVWGQRAAVIARDGTFAIIDTKTNKSIRKARIPKVIGFAAGLVAAGNTVYALGLDGKLYSIGATKGYTTRDLGFRDGVYATPILKDNVLYAADESGMVIAFNLESEERIWVAKAAPNVGRGLDLVMQNDQLIVSSEGGTITVLAMKDGKRSAPDIKVPGPLRCAPLALDDFNIEITLHDGTLEIWDLETGSKRPNNGQPKIKGSRTQRPIHHGSTVFVSPRDRELLAFDPNTGDPSVGYRPMKSVTRVKVSPTDRIVFAHGSALTAYARGRDSYAPAWVFRANGRITFAPLIVDGAVYIGDDRGFIYRVDANDE